MSFRHPNERAILRNSISNVMDWSGIYQLAVPVQPPKWSAMTLGAAETAACKVAEHVLPVMASTMI